MRVISRKYKGREIKSPQTSGTHPMGEREKNAVFNMVASELAGARVLDAYAGTGALGIEALSRGADSVDFVDSSAVAIRTIRDNLRSVGLGSEQLARYSENVAAPTVRVLRGKIGAVEVAVADYDLVFADPPYDNFVVSDIAALADYLRPDGALVLSHPAKTGELNLPGLDLVKTRKYAGARISIYQKM